ncbi:FAD-dependent oxidoreductase [Halomarina litorea]|uniref:FAD-dependent oxidoreductase n=1 Tax=Halomarina litorea TaxID=2961595 RepID=UPI0020C29B56|nr:FAD-dependent oxidoreductase [Halomarina sp. BCD28]
MSGDADLPEETAPLWATTAPRTDYAPMAGDEATDVAVVGGGIVGVTTAFRLLEDGYDVTLLERDRVVEGVTGRTTAKVTSLHGLVYDRLRGTLGADAARQYGEANEAAVDEIGDRVAESDIDCGFRRLPAYTYARSGDDRSAVRREAEVADGLGLPASFVGDDALDLPYRTAGAVAFADQAQFDPRRYLLALVEQFVHAGGRVFERTKVTDVDGGVPCRVETDRGTVRADDVVLATHFPIQDRGGFFARMYPKRSYVLAVTVDGEVPDGMYYDHSDPYRSLRPHRHDGEEYLLVGGENHKTGQADAAERYRRLAAFAREHFDVTDVRYRWSTQDYVTTDRVPYVGRLGPATDHCFVATGFGGWGMTNGTAAASVLAALVAGRDHRWADLYSPRRVTLSGRSLRELVTENADSAGHFLRGWLRAADRRSLDGLAPGEGTVVREGTSPVAVSRDESGDLRAVSAVCPHMKCVVDWNAAERSWDCPCHGSRFDADGEVIDGPATEALATRYPRASRD